MSVDFRLVLISGNSNKTLSPVYVYPYAPIAGVLLGPFMRRTLPLRFYIRAIRGPYF